MFKILQLYVDPVIFRFEICLFLFHTSKFRFTAKITSFCEVLAVFVVVFALQPFPSSRPQATKCTVYLLVNVNHRGVTAVSVQSQQPMLKSKI